MNEKQKAIRDKAATELQRLWEEAEQEICIAIARAIEDAQANEQECVFTVGFAIALDFGKDKQRHKLSFGKPRKYESESSMPNPLQPELFDGDEDHEKGQE